MTTTTYTDKKGVKHWGVMARAMKETEGCTCASLPEPPNDDCPVHGADAYFNEMVTRTAPRWAWDVIDETLSMDAQSNAFDKRLRKQIREAFIAMMETSDPEIDAINES